ncbi:hypothetical protein EDB86DRAFT_2805128, partial [Lactarius hatsudake]
LPEPMAHLCPIRAYAKWIKASRIKKGYMFCKLGSRDRISENNQPMTAECFLEMFHNNLIDIGVDPVAYSTHSFRL